MFISSNEFGQIGFTDYANKHGGETLESITESNGSLQNIMKNGTQFNSNPSIYYKSKKDEKYLQVTSNMTQEHTKNRTIC